MRHGTCFRRRLSAHHAGAAPHSAVAELGVVRRFLVSPVNEAEQARIKEAWLTLPASLRSDPASEAELTAFEERYGSIPPDFRWFLAVCGGGPVGSEWVDDISKLPRTHDNFRKQCSPQNGWTMRDVFLIGWDGAGNPFGIHIPTGELRVEDHNFGGVHRMAESFARFLLDASTNATGNA